MFVVCHFIWFRDRKSILFGEFSVLYEGIKGDWMSKLYGVIYLGRRFLLAVFLITIRNSVAQITILLLLHAFIVLYTVIVRPFISWVDNVMETINEIGILIVTGIFLTLRKDYDLDEEDIETRTQNAIWVLSIIGMIGVIVALIVFIARCYLVIAIWYQRKQERKQERINNAKSYISPVDLPSRSTRYRIKN